MLDFIKERLLLICTHFCFLEGFFFKFSLSILEKKKKQWKKQKSQFGNGQENKIDLRKKSRFKNCEKKKERSSNQKN
jgi:hypothetical protein